MARGSRFRRQEDVAAEVDSGASAAAALPAGSISTADAERVEGCKVRLATLFSHEAELDVELSELEAAVER
jgi:hypothetical protein